MEGGGPQLFVFPEADRQFTQTVKSSLTNVGGRPIEDAGVLAAVEALLRSSYPLATVQRREETYGGSKAWDVFRDDDELDNELVRRARAGLTSAAERLYDRHERLVYAVALNTAGQADLAADAVVAAFVSVIAEPAGHHPARIRLAAGARAAALRGAGGQARRPVSRAGLQTAVLELAHSHRLTGHEIAAVLGLEMPDVRNLATEGLRTFLNQQEGGV